MNSLITLLAGADIFRFDLIEILLHVANFVVLFVVLYLLLFKPVKKFIAKRNENLIKVSEENKKLSDEVTGMKDEYDKLIVDAKQELAKANEQAKVIAQQRSDEILAEANEQAKTIMVKAKAEIESERVRAETEIKGQVAELSVEVAKKIISKNIDAKANSKLIEDSLKRWKADDEQG